MGYLVGIVIVIVIVVELVRLIIFVLSGLVSAGAGMAHALAGFFAAFGLDIAMAIVAAGLLWGGFWLASELGYLLRDRRAERRWFQAIAPRIAAAMLPGSSYEISDLGAPPRPPRFGRGAEHRLTPPLPGFLGRLTEAGTQAAEEDEEDDAGLSAGSPDSAGMAGVLLPAPAIGYGIRRADWRYRVREPTAPASENLNSLPAGAQLSRIRELADVGTRVSFTAYVITEDAAAPERPQGQAAARPGTCNVTDVIYPAAHPHQRTGQADAAPHARGRLIVVDSTGVQAGDHNRQYNFFTYQVVTPKIGSLADRLRDRDVVAATRRLAADPQDPAARRALLNKIAPGGLRLGGSTSTLDITVLRSHATRSGSWLDGIVFFRDVTGGQIGDHNTQRNEFVYVVAPTMQARELLAANRDLAKAVIDCAFPARGRRDPAEVARKLQSAVEGMRVEPDDGRTRSVRYDPPAAGETLRIQAHDGVSIGYHSTVSRKDTVVARPSRGRISWEDLGGLDAARPAVTAPGRPIAVSRDDDTDSRSAVTRPSRTPRGISGPSALG